MTKKGNSSKNNYIKVITHKSDSVIQTYNIVDYNRQKEKEREEEKRCNPAAMNDDILSCGSYMVNNN